MAAQAVDFTVSGHVNRALFITDNDTANSTSATVKDNASSGTRIRVKGSGEPMEGSMAGVVLEYAAGSELSLRYADLWYGGGFGKISIGHGDQGGEGSVYKRLTGVTGIGHGQDHAGVAAVKDPLNRVAGDGHGHGEVDDDGYAVVGQDFPADTTPKGLSYYISLDGGAGRNERIRYDTPDIGPLSAAVSLGNGDQVSAGLTVKQSVGGASFQAGIGTNQWSGEKSTISASAGVMLESGIAFSAAWGRGKHHEGMTIPGEQGWLGNFWRYLNLDAEVDGNWDDDPNDTDTLREQVTMIENQIMYKTKEGTKDGPTKLSADQVDSIKRAYNNLIVGSACIRSTEGAAEPETWADRMGVACTAVNANRRHGYMVAGRDHMPTTVDPSFLQAEVSYTFGDTKVGVSWYQSNDAVNDGSELTALGLGVNHSLPKVGAEVYAAAQNYAIEDDVRDVDSDHTVVMIGTRITF